MRSSYLQSTFECCFLHMQLWMDIALQYLQVQRYFHAAAFMRVSKVSPLFSPSLWATLDVTWRICMHQSPDEFIMKISLRRCKQEWRNWSWNGLLIAFPLCSFSTKNVTYPEVFLPLGSKVWKSSMWVVKQPLPTCISVPTATSLSLLNGLIIR